MIALALLLTILFSSPDDPSSTVKSWSRSDPVDFVTTAVSELDGTSGTATYGPPYNHASSGQHIAFVYLQKWLGVGHPINTANDYVLLPLAAIPGQPALRARWPSTPAHRPGSSRRGAPRMPTRYRRRRPAATARSRIPAGDYGPVQTMMSALLADAQSGGLDGQLLTNDHFYQTDYTKPLLLLADGGLLADRAQAEHLLGEQWGMMNETGSSPDRFGSGCTPSGTRSSRSRPRPTLTSW